MYLQTDFDTEDGAAVVLCDRHYFCADWRGVIMGERAGMFTDAMGFGNEMEENEC